MYRHSFKEDFGSEFCNDTLLVVGWNGHLGKFVDDHEKKLFPCLVKGRNNMKSAKMDYHSLIGVGRGVYMPRFLIVDLEITQEV